VAASVVNSRVWKDLIKYRLSENIRAREDPEFAAFLLKLGNCELQIEDSGLVALPRQILHSFQTTPNPVEEITAVAFPERSTQMFLPQELYSPP
jgi:hypothetical protein